MQNQINSLNAAAIATIIANAAKPAVPPTWIEGLEFEAHRVFSPDDVLEGEALMSKHEENVKAMEYLREQAEDAVWGMFGGDAKRVMLLNDNPEIARQVGLAAYHLPYWVFEGEWGRASVSDKLRNFLRHEKIGLPVSTVNGSEIILGRAIWNVSDGEIFAAVIARNVKATIVPEVYRLVDGAWKYMPETHVSRARTYAWAKAHGVKHVPLTYWHIIAAILAGKTLRTIGDDGTERIIGRFMQEAVEAYIAAADQSV